MSGEKKRLEQFLLQSRASRSTLSNIIQVDPRFSSFQPVQIDTIRLRAAQKEAGKQPVSEKLIKEQKKKKKKARRPKQLRGEVGRAIREQKRFERGERRDRPEEEPRIVGEPRNTGLSYDPDIERRRLDIQERQIAAANVRSLADRRAAAAAQERELAVRRGELAAGRAERRAAREAAARPPVALPDIRVEGARIEGPLVAGPLVAPEVADPIPEIIRLGDRIRGDYDAFGAQQDEKNRQILTDVRSLIDRQEARDEARVREARETKLREEAELRQKLARQDARYQSVEERLGAQELSMSQARDSVIQEIRDAEQRLKTSQKELDQPTSYDDVFLRAVEEESQTEPTGTGSGSLRQSRFEEVTPSPSVARPPTPVTPVEEGTQPEPEGPEALLQSQTLGGDVIEGGGVFDLPSVTIPEARLSTEQDLTLSPVSDQARLYPPGTAGQGPIRGGAGALRLDTEETRAQRAARTTPVREPLIESPVATPRTAAETPSTREEEELVAEHGRILEEAEREAAGETSQQSMGEEFLPGSFVGQSGVSEEPLRPVSERIEEIERVIEPAGVQAETQLRPLDPDVLFEAFEEAEEVGQVQDQRAQRIRDSQTTYQDSFPELSGEVRTGPRGKRGQRGGLGYRVRNNTDKPLKKIQPGDVVNIIGVEEGEAGEGRYRFDTQTAAGTRVSTDQLGPLIDDGSLIFEKGHRHELGGHFDENPYGPIPTQGAASQVEQAEQEEEEEEPERTEP